MKRPEMRVCAMLLATAFLLSSCGSASASKPDASATQKLTSPAELAEDATAALQQDYESFSIDCNAPNETDFADQYYHLNYDWQTWTDDECIQKIKSLGSLEGMEIPENEIVVSNKYEDNSATGDITEYQYETDDAIIALATSAYNTYYFSGLATTQILGRERVGQYRLNEGDTIEGISYQVAGQDYSLEDAVDFANEFVQSLQPILGFESASLRKIQVYQLEEDQDELKAGDCVYYLFYQKTLEGTALNFDCATIWDVDIPSIDEALIFMMITAPGKAPYWCDSREKHITSMDAQDGVLPLSYALKAVDSQAAKYSRYTVSSAELNYVALEWARDKSTFYYEPYWCIKLGEGYNTSGVSNMQWDPVDMAYVNAITGECYIVSSIPGRLMGMSQYFENPKWDPQTNPDSPWRIKESA